MAARGLLPAIACAAVAAVCGLWLEITAPRPAPTHVPAIAPTVSQPAVAMPPAAISAPLPEPPEPAVEIPAPIPQSPSPPVEAPLPQPRPPARPHAHAPVHQAAPAPAPHCILFLCLPSSDQWQSRQSL
jgi:hypothetical protein